MILFEKNEYSPKKWPNYHRQNMRDKNSSENKAWNAADEYLLRQLEGFSLKDRIKTNSKILIVNDNFGTLALALHHYKPVYLTDSFISWSSMQQNLSRHSIQPWQNEPLHSIKDSSYSVTSFPTHQSLQNTQFDYIVFLIPKSLSYFEHQLQFIRPMVSQQTTLIAAGMVKHISKNTKQSLEKFFTDIQVNKVIRKAILFTASSPASSTTKEVHQQEISYTKDTHQIQISATNQFHHIPICHFPGVFAKGKLDKATRLLLSNLPDLSNSPNIQKVADLGCGTGIIGIFAKRLFPDLQLYFIDEFYPAILSTQKSLEENGITGAQLIWGNGLFSFDTAELDCIITNPPFHETTTLSKNLAIRLFDEAHKKLRTGGMLIAVGNRGLRYEVVLNRKFKEVKLIAEDKQYQVLQALK